MDEQRDPHITKEFVREGVTMALYLSLSLLAVLLALPSSTTDEDPVGLVFLTASGLLVAHLLASAIASRLVSRGLLEPAARAVAMAQIGAGLLVIAIVLLPLLVFDPPTSVTLAEGLLLAFVCWVGYVAARQANVSRARSWIYVVIVLICVAMVLMVKAIAGH